MYCLSQLANIVLNFIVSNVVDQRIHNCKNLEQYRNVQKERLKDKLFSANCNFSKVNKI